MNSKYNIVMFAYNEESHISASIMSIYQNIDDDLNKFFVLANGCTDSTVEKSKEIKKTLSFEKMEIVDIEIGDKCNAWNFYVHEIANGVDTHFFVDADVYFSQNCFPLLHTKLQSCEPETVAVAGMPLSGRNLKFYQSLVIERSCFFGNLYGLRNSFVKHLKVSQFRLPRGLNWIDSFLTKAVNTNLTFSRKNLPQRTTWISGVGYEFNSLSIFKISDLKLYINRISRYELGKIQERFLDRTPVQDWPKSMDDINLAISKDFERLTAESGLLKRFLIRKRLKKLLLASTS